VLAEPRALRGAGTLAAWQTRPILDLSTTVSSSDHDTQWNSKCGERTSLYCASSDAYLSELTNSTGFSSNAARHLINASQIFSSDCMSGGSPNARQYREKRPASSPSL